MNDILIILSSLLSLLNCYYNLLDYLNKLHKNYNKFCFLSYFYKHIILRDN